MLPKNVLLVEDEDHKITDLRARLVKQGVASSNLTCVSSVREAVLLVSSYPYDLIILDMALPTFTKSESTGTGGLPQTSGGVEVLRALKARGHRTRIIIVTQFPEFVINGERFKPSRVSPAIKRLYDQDVIGTVIYSFNDPDWESRFDQIFKAAT